ncbi:MAG: hypothetical protein Q8P11_00525 [bacterium]|nr:hypothetical protein [bacterium]
MQLQTILFMAVAILAGALGNVLIKIGTQHQPNLDINLAFIGSVLKNPYIIVGVILMVGTFPFYTEVMQRIPLHIAFPIMTASMFILADLASYFFLHETLTLLNLAGMLVVIVGLVLMAYR